MEYKDFEARVKAAGLTPRDCGNGHWRIENGRYEVNWWPHSKKRTIYVNGLSAGNVTRYGDLETAIAAATTDPDIKRRGKRGERKNNYRKEKRALLRKDPRCHWCKCDLTTKTATLDHVIPLARGGSNATDNMVLSCGPCNKEKGNELWDKDRKTTDGGERGPHLSDEAQRPRREQHLCGHSDDAVRDRSGDDPTGELRGGGEVGGGESNRESSENVLGRTEYQREANGPAGEPQVDRGLGAGNDRNYRSGDADHTNR